MNYNPVCTKSEMDMRKMAFGSVKNKWSLSAVRKRSVVPDSSSPSRLSSARMRDKDDTTDLSKKTDYNRISLLISPMAHERRRSVNLIKVERKRHEPREICVEKLKEGLIKEIRHRNKHRSTPALFRYISKSIFDPSLADNK